MSVRTSVLCAIAVLLSIWLGGCASIVHGSSQDITVSSSPLGAAVHTADGGVYATPCKITLKRNKDCVLCVTKDGYATQQVKLSSVLSGAMAGNIIFGGIIGGAVDAASGAAWRLEPETVAVTLVPLGAGEVAAAPSFNALTCQQRLENLEALKRSGNISNDDYVASRRAIESEMGKSASPPHAATGGDSGAG